MLAAAGSRAAPPGRSVRAPSFLVDRLQAAKMVTPIFSLPSVGVPPFAPPVQALALENFIGFIPSADTHTPNPNPDTILLPCPFLLHSSRSSSSLTGSPRDRASEHLTSGYVSTATCVIRCRTDTWGSRNFPQKKGTSALDSPPCPPTALTEKVLKSRERDDSARAPSSFQERWPLC